VNEYQSLPLGWAYAKLADITLPSGTRNPLSEGEGEILYVDIEALDNSSQRITAPKRLSNADAPSRARLAIKSGDVLFSLVRPYLNLPFNQQQGEGEEE
jgi:hypothetical protein